MNSNVINYLDRKFGVDAKFIFCMYYDKAGILKQVFSWISAENALKGESFSKAELLPVYLIGLKRLRLKLWR